MNLFIAGVALWLAWGLTDWLLWKLLDAALAWAKRKWTKSPHESPQNQGS